MFHWLLFAPYMFLIIGNHCIFSVFSFTTGTRYLSVIDITIDCTSDCCGYRWWRKWHNGTASYCKLCWIERLFPPVDDCSRRERERESLLVSRDTWRKVASLTIQGQLATRSSKRVADRASVATYNGWKENQKERGRKKEWIKWINWLSVTHQHLSAPLVLLLICEWRGIKMFSLLWVNI